MTIFPIRNDEQMSNKVGVEYQPDKMGSIFGRMKQAGNVWLCNFKGFSEFPGNSALFGL